MARLHEYQGKVILAGRSDVFHRHHAGRRPRRDEMAAVLLRTFCPVAILLGPLKGPDLVQALAIQTGWLLLTWMWVRFIWQRGFGHYQAVGG